MLAAGAGSRFGGGKLMARLADGTPVGLAAWRNLKAAIADCVVVVRRDDTELRQLMQDEGATVIECSDAQQGMSRSLVAGLRATGNCRGWVIALGDMPYIKPTSIARVRDALEQGELIVLPTYRGKRGHPVGLSSRLREELLAIAGDEGAREVVKRHATACHLVACDDDPGILHDIDTREDLEPGNSGL